jgi:hypothetical protein
MKNIIHLGLNQMSHIYFHLLTRFYIKTVPIVVDIGCGTRPQPYIIPYLHVCIDPYKPYLDKIEETKDRIWVKKCGDWKYAIDMMQKGMRANSVFLLDIIEHVNKEESLKLLKETELWVNDQIIVFTPLGYFEQKETDDGKDAWGMNGTEYQRHRSGWYPEDFGDGWTVWIIPYAHIVNSLDEPIKPASAILAIYNKRK